MTIEFCLMFWYRFSGRDADAPDLSSVIASMVTQAASLAGLDTQQCVSRSICEAYRQPERYGILLLPIRYFLIQVESS